MRTRCRGGTNILAHSDEQSSGSTYNSNGLGMKRVIASVATVGVVLTLGGCGYNPGDRALSGGMLGAATGAGIVALTGGPPWSGPPSAAPWVRWEAP
jgi:hypothetical protein